MHQPTHFRWHSYKKFYATLIFAYFLFVAALSKALDGDLQAMIILIIGLLLGAISLSVIIQKGVWVVINDVGVTYQNVFGRKALQWSEISDSYTLRIRLVNSVYLRSQNGKSYTLPITGAEAKSISDTINRFISEK
jgi:hypothetical protein